MDCEILAVGSEMLTPAKIDTNSLWMTDQLNALGVEVTAKSVVGDDRDRLVSHLANSLARVPLVLISGGLGPTEDDVTRDAVAQVLGRPQYLKQHLLDDIAGRFARMKRNMAENNKRQAMLIEGAEPLPNPRGTAPGQWIAASNGRYIALLPGPPKELKGMFTEQILPRLRTLLPPLHIHTRHYCVAGIGESDLDQLIAPVYTKYTNPSTTILASPGDVHVHLRARCSTPAEAEALLNQVAPQIVALLGDRIYSDDGATLQETVGRNLIARNATVSVAESCTGGMIGNRITSVPGSSQYFVGGFLAYSDQMKQSLLGISAELLAAHTAVSEPVAKAMAAAARDRTGSTWALSTTGYAGPGGGTEADPAGTVYIGLAGPDNYLAARRIQFIPDRDRVRTLAAITALDMLRRQLK